MRKFFIVLIPVFLLSIQLVLAADTFNITTLNNGQDFYLGESFVVEWDYSGFGESSMVCVKLMSPGGQREYEIKNTGTPGCMPIYQKFGHFDISDKSVTPGKYLIKSSIWKSGQAVYSDEKIVDVSVRGFEIFSPRAGNILYLDEGFDVAWKATNFPADKQICFSLREEGSDKGYSIESGSSGCPLASSGKATYTLKSLDQAGKTFIAPGKYYIYGSVPNGLNYQKIDQKSSVFSVLAPRNITTNSTPTESSSLTSGPARIEVKNPLPGETFYLGKEYYFKWEARGITPSIAPACLELVSATKSHQLGCVESNEWRLPITLSESKLSPGRYKMAIYLKDSPSVRDETNFFTVLKPRNTSSYKQTSTTKTNTKLERSITHISKGLKYTLTSADRNMVKKLHSLKLKKPKSRSLKFEKELLSTGVAILITSSSASMVKQLHGKYPEK